MSEPTIDPVARIAAGHRVTQEAQAQRLKERQAMGYEEPETSEQRMDRLLQKMHDDPEWYNALPSVEKIALGHHYRNKLRAEALLGPNPTADQR
jgi:hypothetical protein